MAYNLDKEQATTIIDKKSNNRSLYKLILYRLFWAILTTKAIILDLLANSTSLITELSKKDLVRKPSVRSSYKTIIKLKTNKSNLEAYID